MNREPCQHRRYKDECPVCTPQQASAPEANPSPKVGVPNEGEPKKGMSMIWWLFIGGIVGAVAVKLVENFWPKKPQTVYHVGGAPPNGGELPPAGQPPGWWQGGQS